MAKKWSTYTFLKEQIYIIHGFYACQGRCVFSTRNIWFEQIESRKEYLLLTRHHLDIAESWLWARNDIINTIALWHMKEARPISFFTDTSRIILKCNLLYDDEKTLFSLILRCIWCLLLLFFLIFYSVKFIWSCTKLIIFQRISRTHIVSWKKRRAFQPYSYNLYTGNVPFVCCIWRLFWVNWWEMTMTWYFDFTRSLTFISHLLKTNVKYNEQMALFRLTEYKIQFFGISVKSTCT